MTKMPKAFALCALGALFATSGLARADECNTQCVDTAIATCVNAATKASDNWWAVSGEVYNCVTFPVIDCGQAINGWLTENATMGWVQVDTRPSSAPNTNCIHTFKTN